MRISTTGERTESDDIVTKTWPDDSTVVNTPNSYQCRCKWDDAAVIPAGETGNRKDGPFFQSVTIVAADAYMNYWGPMGEVQVDPLIPARNAKIGCVEGDTLNFSLAVMPFIPNADSGIVWCGSAQENQGEFGYSDLVTSAVTGSVDVTFSFNNLSISRSRGVIAKRVYGPGEDIWAIEHPIEAYTASQLADEASNWAWGLGQHNGRADACRHAYWNAIMTLDMSASAAEGASTAHEYSELGTSPHDETAMDMINNEVGRGLTGTTHILLQEAVDDAADSGALTVMDSDRLLVPSS